MLALISPLAAATCLVMACGEERTSSPIFGFNEDPKLSELSLQPPTGMIVRRVQVPWNAVESAPGTWDWAPFDDAYRAILDAGLEPLIVAGGSPCWAHPELGCDPITQSPPDRSFTPSWAEYIGRLAARYPEAIGIEIWNEPNIAQSFGPQPDPQRYSELLQAAYAAIKNIDPAMPVVSGGLLASATSSDVHVADSQFLAAVYAAGGAAWLDAIGIHPYPVRAPLGDSEIAYDIPTVETTLERLRAVRDSAGSRAPLWITETGVSTVSSPGSPPAASEAQQAEYLLDLVQQLQQDSDVEVVLIHRLIDAAPDPLRGPGGLIEAGFGVYRADGTPKPAACALSGELGGSLAC